jgi:hypothetical protein
MPTGESQLAGINKPAWIDFHLAVLRDRLNRARKIRIVHTATTVGAADAAARNFNRAHVGFGSFATEAGKAKGPCTPASPRKRSFGHIMRSLAECPTPDIPTILPACLYSPLVPLIAGKPPGLGSGP